MRHLAAILHEHINPSQEVVFGRADTAQAEAPRLDVDRLTERLNGQTRFNNRLIVAIVSSYLAILALGAALLVAHHTDPRWVAATLGGNVLTLAASVGFVRDLWREKNYMDMLLGILPSSTPAEAMKMIRSFYFAKAGGKGRPVTRMAVA